jgi:hypothetical protein
VKNIIIICLIASILILPKALKYIDFSMLPLLVFILALILTGKKHVNVINENTKIVFITLYLIILLVLITSMLNSNVNFDNVLKPVRVFLLYVSLLYVFIVLKFDDKYILYGIVAAALVNGFFIYTQYIGEYIGYDYLKNIGNYSFSEGNRSTPYRKSGLMSGFPTAGMLSLFGFIFSIYLYYVSRNKTFIVISLFLLVLQLITSRTSLILSIITVVVIFLISNYRNKIKIVAVFLFSALLVYAVLPQSLINSEHLYKTSVHMFELFTNVLNNSSFETNSTNSLFLKHYFYPDDYVTFLLGDTYGVDNNYGASDVFFIRVLNSQGVVVLFLYLFLYLYMMYVNIKFNKIKMERRVIFYVQLLVIIASFKGSYIFARTVGDISTILFIMQVARFESIKLLKIRKN